MKPAHWLKSSLIILGLFFNLGIVVAQTSFAADSSDADDDAWPRKFTSQSQEFIVYQPQVESWQGTSLEQRSAVAVQMPGSKDPVFGVVWMTARTDVDKSERLVALQDIHITKVNFPTETAQTGELKTALEQNAIKIFGTISLDRLRASLAIGSAETQHRVTAVKNEPPQIIYADKPAVLVMIDGPAVLRDSGTEGILRVVNTHALVLFNKDDARYYIRAGNGWLASTSITGPWTHVSPDSKLSGRLGEVLSTAKEAKDTDLLENSAPASNSEIGVFTSTGPAELVQTKGQPQFEPITETSLLYVTNTPNNIFMNTKDQNYYVTLSGRWFKSKSLQGPWEYQESDHLPADFAKIPETHPKGEVLASVSGTPDSKEAAIANDIPQTATVDRSQANLNVTYDGQPQFQVINGTSMQYAVNTPTPVIMTAPGSYYAVENGVWFMGPSPAGPWAIASSVPQVIYTIPPTSPVYNVTYVYVYGSTPRYVYVGYLPGYLGSYVTPSGVVVYGTGYYYNPWIHHYWYGYPVTYGFGFYWGFGFGWVVRPVYYGAPFYHPWWGPWPHYWAAVHPGFYRPFTVNHINIYRGWNRSVVRPSNIQPYRPASGRPFMNRSNNVYADHSGNVFRNQNENWEKYNNSHRWEPVSSGAGSTAKSVSHSGATTGGGVKDLNQERSARERGQNRAIRYRPTSTPKSTGGARKQHR